MRNALLFAALAAATGCGSKPSESEPAGGSGGTAPAAVAPVSDWVVVGDVAARIEKARLRKPVVEELYDHVADFDETKNLIADPQFAEVRDALRKRTTELRDKYGGPYRPNPADKKK